MSQKLCRDELLALDIATNTGYYSTHSSGTWCFIESKARNDNKAHKAFRDTVMGFIQRHNIKQVVAEGVNRRTKREQSSLLELPSKKEEGKANVGTHFAAVKSLSEFHGILLEVCDELGLPAPEYVNPMTLKKFAAGNGRATKLDMINACKTRYNFQPRTDDEADSFWLYKYYCQKHRI